MGVVIGLTGGIASGKSTVSAMISELGIPVVDADQIAREVVKPGKVAYKKIVAHFGYQLLNSDKTINRKKLGKIVFSNVKKREILNKIIHPQIRKEMLHQRDLLIENGAECVVLDIPLLFENNLMHYVDKTIVVYVKEITQRERLMNRDGLSEEDTRERINAQIPINKKAKMADAIIDNSGSKQSSYHQLLDILKSWNVLQREK